MSSSFSFFGQIPTVQNGMGSNLATSAIELGGDLIRATVLNTSVTNTLSLTGLVNGDPINDSVLSINPAGVVGFLTPAQLTNDFWRSNAGNSQPDGANDTTELIGRIGAVVIGSNTQVGTSQLSVVSDTNGITDPIISAQSNNLTQGVDILWGGITKSGTGVNSDLGITAKGTGNIVLQASINGMTAATGNVGINVAAPVAMLDVNGAQILRSVAIADLAAGGAVGTAAATVNIASTLVLNQTTANQALTLPAPTNTTAGRILFVTHNGAAAGTSVGGKLIATGETLTFVWDGNSWNGNASPLIADFWRTITNVLPDGVTDTADSIRRLGHVGIGGAAITDAMPTVTTPSATNMYLQLSGAATGRGQLMYGTNPSLYYMTRTLPTVVNDYVDIGSLTVGAQASSFILSINVSDGGFAATKLYAAAMNWHATGGAWRVLRPLSDGGAFNANNYELLVNVNNGVIALRIRRVIGATAGTARIYLQCYGDPATVLTESIATATDATAYTIYDPFPFSLDFWRSGGGTTLPDGNTDTSEFVSRTGAVGIGSNTQVGTSQLSVVSDTNVITDPIASFQTANLTQGVDILWSGIKKSGTGANTPLSINAAGTGNIILHGSPAGEAASAGFVGINIASPVAMLDVNGAQVLRPVTIADRPTGGSVGLPAATVDIASVIILNQATNAQSLTIPNPTNTTAGRILYVTQNGAATGTTINGYPIFTDRTIPFIWDGNSWNPHTRVAINEWLLTGNAGTNNTVYADATAQGGNFLGTTDNTAINIYTNASSASDKADLRLYTATHTTATISNPIDIFHVRRNGQSGVTYPQTLTVALGHWFADASARTRADIKLGNGNVYISDTTNLSLFSQGGVGITGNGAAADWAWTGNGGISRGNGGALLGLMGANASNNVGPHIGAWTNTDTFPLFYQLNWQHDNIAVNFDGYFDGAFRASHTTRPYQIYKTGDRLQIRGSAAAPAAAGNNWTSDLIASFRYAGATLAGGEFFLENAVKNRRIVLWDANAVSDHQFYGFGINGSTLRFQTDSISSSFRWFAATSATTSNEIMSLIGNGRLGLGNTAPTAQLHVNGANANAGAGAPLFRVSDTNIAGSYFAIDNGAAANDYRLITSTNLELQAGANTNQLFLNTNGGVGIGTNAPTAGIGNISVAVNGLKPGGGAWGAFSDQRIKRDITEVKIGLAEILKLRPVTFAYNGKAGMIEDGRTHYGLIAQDVQKVIPDVVETHDVVGYDEMSEEDQALFADQKVLVLNEGISAFDAAMIKAIQALAERIATLESLLK